MKLKKHNKKLIWNNLLVFLLLISFLLPMASGAVAIPNPLRAQNFTELLNMIINFIFYLALGIAPIMIIVAGFFFITAQGEPEKIMTAKRIILWVSIGLIVVFCAKGLIQLFKQFFGVQSGF